MKALMTERSLTIIERWALAVGAPIVSAGIIATCAILWGLYNTQVQMHHQLAVLIDVAYTEQQAEREIGEIERRVDRHGNRIDRLERHAFPGSYRSGSGS